MHAFRGSGNMAASILNATRLWSVHDSVRLATTSTAPFPNATTLSPAEAAAFDSTRAAESNLVQILSVLTVIHLLALVCVSLRVYTRVVLVKSPGMDDVCMVLSGACAVGGWAAFLIQAQHGLGRHQDTLSSQDMVAFMHAGFWQAVVSATCALAFLKLSIGFNLLRLSTNKWYTWCLRVTMGAVVCYSFMGAMTFFFHCKPMAGSWDISLKPSCYSMKLFVTFGLVNTSFNIATDVLFAVFPIFVIWPLNMKRRLRIYLICILSLGYIAVAMGVAKAVYQTGFIKEFDWTFRSSVTFWGFLELNLGIIAACTVTLKPLLNRLLGLESTRHPYHPYNGSAMPLRRNTARKQKSVLINLSPHPDEVWTGPRHPDQGYSYELGNISAGKFGGGRGGVGAKTPSTANTSKSDLFSFYDYDDDKRWEEGMETEAEEAAIVDFDFPAPLSLPPPPPIPPRSPRRTQVAVPLPRPNTGVQQQEGGIVRTTEFMVSAMLKDDRNRNRVRDRDRTWV